jgi:quinol monooxygenase YgiN
VGRRELRGASVLSICGYLTFRPEDRDEVLEGLRAVSVRSRQDPGCVDYWWAEDVEEPNRFRFFECWASKEMFDAHRSQPYEAEFDRDFVSRITGADAHITEGGARRSVVE